MRKNLKESFPPFTGPCKETTPQEEAWESCTQTWAKPRAGAQSFSKCAASGLCAGTNSTHGLGRLFKARDIGFRTSPRLLVRVGQVAHRVAPQARADSETRDSTSAEVQNHPAALDQRVDQERVLPSVGTLLCLCLCNKESAKLPLSMQNEGNPEWFLPVFRSNLSKEVP